MGEKKKRNQQSKKNKLANNEELGLLQETLQRWEDDLKRVLSDLSNEREINSFAGSDESSVLILRYELLRKLVSNNQVVDMTDNTIEWLFGDKTCLELFLGSGDIMSNDYRKAIDLLVIIINSNPLTIHGFKLKLAVATAISFACPVPVSAVKNSFIDGLDRYNTFSKWADENVFFDTFYNLTTWHLRYVVGSWHQTDELTWARENIVDCCKDPLKVAEATFKMMTYTKQNDEGVSIHKKAEYYHFLPVTLENYYKYGGVCGAISRFGVAMAQAHGIPALMVGQPGHGAFIWYKGDSWTLANKVRGWDKSKTNPRIQFTWRRDAPFFQLMNDAQKKLPQYLISEKLRVLSTLTDPNISIQLLFSALVLCHENFRVWEDMKIILENPDLKYTVVHELLQPTLEEKLPIINSTRNLSADSDIGIESCSDESKFSASGILNLSQQHWGTSDDSATVVLSMDNPVKVNEIKIHWWAEFKALKYEIWIMEETFGNEDLSYTKVRTEMDATTEAGPNSWSYFAGWDQLTRKIKLVMTQSNPNRRRKKFNFGIRKFEIWGVEIKPSAIVAVLFTENNNSNVTVADVFHEGSQNSKVLSLPQLTVLYSAEIIWKEGCEGGGEVTVKVSNKHLAVKHPDNMLWFNNELCNRILITDAHRNVEAIRIRGVPYDAKSILKMKIRNNFKKQETDGCYCFLQKEFLQLVNTISFQH